MKAIALQLAGADTSPASIEIDGAQAAVNLGLEVSAFRQLMHDGKVSVLCERGTGEDAGLWRATFYYEGRRFRAVVDGHGHILHATGSASP
ncbi:hypothetical protein E5843_02800 [Luteimonas yindakuii]|uniref:DUF6522 family protein n=1 Tax=Luteimonas yindakuii TaxID=2565782 RepID=UPI0010A45C79|nr:DUF6522 family protein [Luteimonas yindakuii]QCO66969.1 hypothetical protein E5843_02800 [Luteimonas yindakuii]